MLSYSEKREIRGAYLVKNICKPFQKNKKTGPPDQRPKTKDKVCGLIIFYFKADRQRDRYLFFKAKATNQYLVR